MRTSNSLEPAESLQPGAAVTASRRIVLLAAKVALLLLSLTFCVAAVEIGMRLAGVPPLQQSYGDPVIGFTGGRNVTDSFYFKEYGGILTMRKNNLGLNEDFDTSVAKPRDTYRMVFVGDSQTAGECANDESFPHVLGRMLSHSGKNLYVEALNAGVGRYSPYQYLVKTKTELVQLKPDHLVVGIYMGNDVMDMMRQDDRPYLVKTPDGRLQHHNPDFIVMRDPEDRPSFLESLLVYGKVHNVVARNIGYQMTRVKLLIHDVEAKGHGLGDVARYMIEVKQLTDISLGFMTQSLLQQVWFRHFPETLPLALEMDRYVLEEFKNLSAAHGMRLTIVLIPTKLLVEPNDFQDVLARVKRHDSTMNVEALQAFENRLTDTLKGQCDELGIQVVDLRRSMLEMKPDARMYNRYEMHLTPVGNRVAGLILYNELGDGLLPERSPASGTARGRSRSLNHN